MMFDDDGCDHDSYYVCGDSVGNNDGAGTDAGDSADDDADRNHSDDASDDDHRHRDYGGYEAVTKTGQ